MTFRFQSKWHGALAAGVARKNLKVTQPSSTVSGPMDSGPAATHDDPMTQIEMIRTAVLAILAASLLAFDLHVVHGTRSSLLDTFRMLSYLHGQLALLLLGVALWPRRLWLRLILGCFFTAMVWLAIARLVDQDLLFRPTLLTQLGVALLMVASFSLPCASVFVVYRSLSAHRLSLFGGRPEAAARIQFGLRHLLLATACFAVVALAAREVVPDSLAGQFTLRLDPQEITTLSLLGVFPGLAAGPLVLAIMRPSWRALWIVPWMIAIGVAEALLVPWLDSASVPAPSASEFAKFALGLAAEYVDLVVALVALVGLARIGGLRLNRPCDKTEFPR